jgi:hypothetical protein
VTRPGGRTGAAHRPLDEHGFVVRTDWPDGVHNMFGWRRGWSGAWRLARRDRAYWAFGPLRPVSWSIVVLTRRQLAEHGRVRECRDPDCQRGAMVFGPDGGTLARL